MAVIPIFYSRVLDDDLLRPFFAGTDIQGQIRKMIGFMTVALGGPSKYQGRSLEAAHSRFVVRGLTDAHFDAFKRHLETSLRRLGAEPVAVDEALRLIESYRAMVLGRLTPL